MKNITEQISIIETNREINAAILKTYLPQNNVQRLPVLSGGKDSKSFESEREILYQVLFDMRRDVTELKKLVNEIMTERGRAEHVPPLSSQTYYTSPSQLMPASPADLNVPTIIHQTTQPASSMHHSSPMGDDIQDTEEYVEETMSLEEAEKELIRKTLEKHHGKRKDTAQDLNISERTLYRKIKAYGLD